MPTPRPEFTITAFVHRGPWWRNRGILLLNIWMILPLLTSTMNGFDSSLINGLQMLPEWQIYFHYPKGTALGLINCSQSLGAFAGLAITPYSSDHLGRRATLFIGSIIMLAGIIVQTLSTTVNILIGARAIIGFGLTFCMNASPLLVTELAYPTQRGIITSLFNTFWYLGSVLSSWICFGTYSMAKGMPWDWRAPTLVQVIIPLLQITLIWFMPESPRFLVSKGLESYLPVSIPYASVLIFSLKESRAARILTRYHGSGDGEEQDALVAFEMAQIRHTLKQEKENVKGKSYLVLVSTPGNRRRMRIVVAIALFSQWSGNGLVSYYINLVLEGVGITSTKEKEAINGGLQIFSFIVALSGAFLVDRLGRRALFLISNSGMLIAFLLWTLTTALFNTMHMAWAAKATIPLIFIFYFFYDIAYTPLLISYALEILPYNIRAKGLAVLILTIYLTEAFNQFVNPWALAAIGWKYYLVYCGWLVLELIFIATYIVETRNCTLEETAVIFDGERAASVIIRPTGSSVVHTVSLPDERQRADKDRSYPNLIESLELRPTGAPSRLPSRSASRQPSRAPSFDAESLAFSITELGIAL